MDTEVTMNKLWSYPLMAMICLGLFSPSLAAEELKAGTAAIFMQGGKMNVGEIGDISRTRLVLQLKDGREFSLGRVWMINFINTDWNFPGERERMEKDEDYIFFKNNDITSGRIIDFSSTRRVFQLDTSEEVPIGRVRRIYLSRNLPPAYEIPQQRTPVAQQGSWSENPDGTVTVQIIFPGRVRSANQGSLVFHWEKNELVAIQYDPSVWGPNGLRLKKT
jgi:hypothetical protein